MANAIKEFVMRRLIVLVFLILFPRQIVECVFLSLFFSHLTKGAECLMKAVKKPKHWIISININRDKVSQLDSNQRESDSSSVRRRRRALARACVHARMRVKLQLLLREVEVFKPSL